VVREAARSSLLQIRTLISERRGKETVKGGKVL
jgi:hypothetical protein